MMDLTGKIVQDHAVDNDIIQLVCFKLAEEEYALNICCVREVIRCQKITPIPQMPSFVLGVVNIRGSVIPVFDLREKFALEKKDFDHDTKILVVDFKGVLVSIIVDAILDNTKVPASKIDPAPTVNVGIERECVQGIALLPDRMITILDSDKVGNVVNAAIGIVQGKEKTHE